MDRNQIPSRSLTLLLYSVQAFIVLGIAFVVLHLSTYDLRVPFSYNGDSVVILMYIKGLIQDGWPTNISQLSAPFTYPGAAFPMLTSVDWLIIRVMSVFTAEPGLLLNGFWLLTLVFNAWSASYVAYQLRLSRVFSGLTGILYAFLPAALLRSVAHLNLVFYFVPLLCLVAVIIVARGVGIRQVKQALIVGLIACALQGFDYIYYSFFAVLLFSVATLIAYRRDDGVKQFNLPLLAIAIVMLSTALNMIPAVQSWHKNGSSPDMGYKYTAEAEIYGAKLRRMLMPHPCNIIPPLANIAQKDLAANFPNENENMYARLGFYGAYGMLLMIIVSLRRDAGINPYAQLMRSISALGMATFLIITVGGVGALINVISVPDIRAYNRFSVFLAFFATVATGFCLQGWLGSGAVRSKIAKYFIVGAFAILSLYDQLLHARPLVEGQPTDMQRAFEERQIVARLEASFPKDAALLELPFTGFPALAHFNKGRAQEQLPLDVCARENNVLQHWMESYDHVRPYLWSHHLKWSWPSFTQRHRTWQIKMQALQGSDLIKAAIFSGFDAIWIDRFAYPDAGQAIISSLSQDKVRQFDTGSSRIAVLDLREAGTTLKSSMSKDEFAEHQSALLGAGVLVEWSSGFYGEEQNPAGQRFRWAQDQANIVLRNSDATASSFCVTFAIASPIEGSVKLEGAVFPEAIKTAPTPQAIKVPLRLESGEARTFEFTSQLQRLSAPGDPRDLYFYVMDFAVTPIGSADKCVNH
jgi:phosphoglycerol transferase